MNNRLIRKYVFIIFFLAVGFFVTPFAFGDEKKLNLEEIYGPGLYDAPVIMRQKFSEEYSKPWHEATYGERSAFIIKWYQQKEAVDAENAARQKEFAKQGRIEDKKALMRKRAWEEFKKAEAKKELEKVKEKQRMAKEIKKLKDDRDKALAEARKRSEARNRHHD